MTEQVQEALTQFAQDYPIVSTAAASVVIGGSTFALTRAVYNEGPKKPEKRGMMNAEEFQAFYDQINQHRREKERETKSEIYFNTNDEFQTKDDLEEIYKLKNKLEDLQEKNNETGAMSKDQLQKQQVDEERTAVKEINEEYQKTTVEFAQMVAD